MARRTRAFTLVELLVVVLILALLMVMLFPSLGKARQAIKRTKCLANLSSIAKSLSSYALANQNKLPPSDPMGAKNPTRALNAYLRGDNYEVLCCPSDVGGDPTKPPSSYFKSQGHSYFYISDGTFSSMGISAVVGSVSYQEERMGEMAGLNEKMIRDALGYNGNGPEEIPDPNAKDANGNFLRARDITRWEIDNEAIPTIMANLAALKGQQNFNINSSEFQWRKTIRTISDPPPPPPLPPPPSYKDPTQYVAGGLPVPRNSGSYNSGQWNHANPWARNTYNIDYWQRSSKKVVLIDWDARLSKGSVQAGKRPNRGFWHDYEWRVNPKTTSTSDETKATEAIVKVHAAFLDGNARAIELNIYSTIDRDANEYY